MKRNMSLLAILILVMGGCIVRPQVSSTHQAPEDTASELRPLIGTSDSPLLPPGWSLSAQELAEMNRKQKLQLESLGQGWDRSKLSEVRLPLPIFVLEDQESFDLIYSGKPMKQAGKKEGEETDGGLRVRMMLLKLPGQSARIPPELKQFEEMIDRTIAFDRNHNPLHESSYVYVAIEQGFVKANKPQDRLGATLNQGYEDGLRRGAHVDGFDAKPINKVPSDHTYMTTNNVPTEFYDHPFVLGEENYQEALLAFDKQVDMSKLVTMQKYVVSLIDAHTVHRVGLAEKNLHRTFIKLKFSQDVFNQEGNTINPVMDYPPDWQWVPKNVNVREGNIGTENMEMMP